MKYTLSIQGTVLVIGARIKYSNGMYGISFFIVLEYIFLHLVKIVFALKITYIHFVTKNSRAMERGYHGSFLTS